jgi:hypothetical protein
MSYLNAQHDVTPQDLILLRRAIELAREARADGQHPFVKRYTGSDKENPTLIMPCREVFARGQKKILVGAPLLEEEAETVDGTERF